MSDDLESQPWMRMGVAATLMKEYAADQRSFFGLLAQMLQSALPDRTTLGYRGFIKKTLSEIRLDLGELSYAIVAPEHGPIHAVRKHVVRGIALKSEEVPIDECLSEIDACLQTEAAAITKARKALADTLGVD